MMWLTLGGGFLATLSTVPAPTAECQVVITIPAAYAHLVVPRAPGQESVALTRSPGTREVKRVITLPAEACARLEHPTTISREGTPTKPAPTRSHPPHPWWTTPKLEWITTVKPTPDPKPAPERPAKPTPSPKRTPKPTKGEAAATAALARLGTPFSWGGGAPSGPTRGIGRGANTIGFDCSGLTLYAWSKAGVTLGHYTGTQFRQGRRVALSDLRKGDLVFFGGGNGDPTHVGLYLGNGIMIHAPKTGDVVKKTQFLKSSYYRSTYRGAVRPG
ncbi:C40 family peptidase [Nonomuraea endophytica]|uniref:Cell wall-associated NlpC family hydrolase n=1 Tax=Nonomuraea endophytica TaxID=714136 RepID=A0A7W8A802_9ACTN|nr:NlpC/P60 family protein [Nonomuraea endophytica]MBB5080734.1 cell wall-associated NlpC family hydrolase [Nonomuraea endophytica]